jgi:lipopolysaccharide biosynthesis glycosyltransferase
MIRIIVGFDQREAVAYHTFCQSVIDKATQPLSITPLALKSLNRYTECHEDGSNAFIYSRFLTPYLCDYSGWAIFADGDMICRTDISELWKMRDTEKAVMCVKHNYSTRAKQKYLGNKNQDYSRKNWSSLVLWNCEHPDNRILTPTFVQAQTGAFLHRFSWLDDSKIGELPKDWNWLTTEYDDNYEAKLLHYTLGTPCFREYRNSEMSDEWHIAHKRTQDGMND